MTTKQMIGTLLLSSPFIFLFIMGIRSMGVGPTVLIFLAATVIIGIVTLGAYLVTN